MMIIVSDDDDVVVVVVVNNDDDVVNDDKNKNEYNQCLFINYQIKIEIIETFKNESNRQQSVDPLHLNYY